MYRLTDGQGQPHPVLDELFDSHEQALEAALAGRGEYKLFACDPALADTANFCAAYGFAPEDSANTSINSFGSMFRLRTKDSASPKVCQ